MIVLGIDAGGSGSRWVLRDDDVVLARAKTKSISGLIYGAKPNSNLENLNNLLNEVVKIAKPEAVLAGISGFSKNSPANDIIRAQIAKKLAINPNKIRLENDMYIAYRNAFELGQGVLLYAGTGSIAYYQDEHRTIRAGGRGYLIDDAGAGFWIGRQALKEILRLEDLGKPVETKLANGLYEKLETRHWPEIKEQIYSGGRKKLASLAPVVALAAQNDDKLAISILQNAAQELTRLARAVLEQDNIPNSLAFAGGISKLSPILAESLRENLSPETSFRLIKTDAVDAAARLALEL